MSDTPLYVGFDLGTTNSAAAVFDGEQTVVVRNAQGSTLTPSVVRIDGRGRLTVGARAQRFLERDPDNTRAEFKRLMGTQKQIEFAASGSSKTPAQLAAELLRSMRADVADQFGVEPRVAVISVPALFELPQSAATSEAAKLAGFERVELLQEPIASALAAGWSADADQEQAGYWLVYDLGGGTFDASLLETADGFLRVVGHDGDNFLGGRDFDWTIVDWAIERINDEVGVRVSRAEASHAGAAQILKRSAEEAKIELSRVREAVMTLPELEVGSKSIEVDLELDRSTLESLSTPLIERSVDVCRRLLDSNGIEPGQLARIVFVGGPTMMPFLRETVCKMLGAVAAEGHDPMTLVARGAAIYAATAGLDARPHAKLERPGRRLWLQYPAVSSDLMPHVVGRLAGGAGAAVSRLQFVRQDGWKSDEITVDPEGGFVVSVELVARKSNRFRLAARTKEGESVPVDPPEITIVQGVTISDPPLSRSIGVALASDQVRNYFERGTPLPARRSFTHHTVESVAKGQTDSVLKIPIVQGEFEMAHLCRLVGSIEIPGAGIASSLPAGSAMELTLEIDRGGRLSARALVPALDQVFEGVAHLLVPEADPESLTTNLELMRGRLDGVRAELFRSGHTKHVAALGKLEDRLDEIERDLRALRGGDADAGQRARRNLIEIDATVEELEEDRRWPELEKKVVETMTWASGWIADRGTPREQKLFDQVADSVQQAQDSRNPRELQRQLRLARQLGETSYFRDPDSWEAMFHHAASMADSATDLPRAQALVREGRALMDKDDHAGLRRVVEKLWKLLPADAKDRRLGFDSGVR